MELERFIAKGKFNEVYKSGGYAVKVFNSGYLKADALHEALVASRLEELGLSVPSVHMFLEQDGHYMLAMDYIEGKTLLQLMLEHPDKKDEYLSRMIQLQMEVFAKRCPNLPMMKRKMLSLIQNADIPAERRIELRAVLDSTPKHIKVCHGDLNPTNIIISAEGTPYLIDSNHATQGNASADIATSYLWFCLNLPDYADLYLSLYASMSGTGQEYIQRWLPIIAAGRLHKNLPEERDILLKWIDTYTD